MANWSSDDFYFGVLSEQHDRYEPAYWQALLSQLQFNEIEQAGGAWAFSSVDTFGPTINLSGSGRWGTGCTLKEECMKKLEDGVVIHIYSSGFDDDVTLRITINHEVVFEEVRKIYDKGFFTEYMGRNEMENSFFREFWEVAAKRRKEAQLRYKREKHQRMKAAKLKEVE